MTDDNADKQKDMTGTKCRCGGTYKETTFFDDIDGVLHCTKCGKKIERWQSR